MLNIIKSYTNQLQTAIDIYKKTNFKKANLDIKAVVILGMGGSGIGGTIIKNLFLKKAKVPIITIKDYEVPSYITSDYLIIASSYSGNTEETLEFLEKVIPKTNKIIGITSGGKLKEICEKHDFDYIKIPGGFPPRACLAYSLVQLIGILSFYNLVKCNLHEEINNSILILKKEKDNIISKAKLISSKIKNTTPIIYSTNNLEGIAERFKQQLNENSKQMAFVNTIPEMNHNEILGWKNISFKTSVIFITLKEEHKQNILRIHLTEEIIKDKVEKVVHIKPKGKSLIEQSLYLINLVDWISWFISENNNVDAMEIEYIDLLKSKL